MTAPDLTKASDSGRVTHECNAWCADGDHADLVYGTWIKPGVRCYAGSDRGNLRLAEIVSCDPAGEAPPAPEDRPDLAGLPAYVIRWRWAA